MPPELSAWVVGALRAVPAGLQLPMLSARLVQACGLTLAEAATKCGYVSPQALLATVPGCALMVVNGDTVCKFRRL